MSTILFNLAERFWPELKEANQPKRLIGAGEVISFLYSLPLAILGIVWLVLVTDIGEIRNDPLIFTFLFGLMFLFRKLSYFIIAEIRSGRYASTDGSLESMVLWIGVFLLGPTALWMAVFWSLLDFVFRWRRRLPLTDRWTRARNFVFYQTGSVLATLVALEVYKAWGGQIPIQGLTVGTILPAMGALFVHFLLQVLLWSGFIAFAVWTQASLAENGSVQRVVAFLTQALGLPVLAHPFAILAAGLYVENGLPAFLFFIFGLVLVAILTRQLSWAAESRRQQSRLLERLEQLSRAILNSPPDATALPLLLQEHVPSMFPSGRVAIWVEPGQPLMTHPIDWNVDTVEIWNWLGSQTETHGLLATEPLPWSSKEKSEHNALIASPILDAVTKEPIGGIYLELFSLAQPWDKHSLANLFPAVMSLGAQVASAYHQAEIYTQALAYQKVSQELSLAGKIQASFLPDELPSFTGWQLAVTLLPARETSGDFFDLIPLNDGKLGILIADVTDKGVGAALYMALSRTLIRTYAIEFGEDPQPDVVLFAANGRILKDARADLFVTCFYGVLDPVEGTLTYSNAGHNPPYLVRDGGVVEGLGQTGIPIGIEEESLWGQATVKIEPGDSLVLYTDGIPDSMNAEGIFYEEKMLLDVLEICRGQSAQELEESIMRNVQDFVGTAPQFDDITLLVLVRDREEEGESPLAQSPDIQAISSEENQ
jgi:serine phosphatase RsbU (regulator of sigma subunit)